MEDRPYYNNARNHRFQGRGVGRGERAPDYGRQPAEGGFRGGRQGRGFHGGRVDRERNGPPHRRGQGNYRGRDGRGRAAAPPHIQNRPHDVIRNNERNNNYERNQERVHRGRPTGPATSRNDAPPAISYTRLKEMYEDENLEGNHIALQLSSSQSGFDRRLREDMDGGMIQMLLKVIAKMCRGDHLPSSFSNVLTAILKSNFRLQLIAFLHDLIREINPIRKAQAPLHVENCLVLLRAWLERIPTTSENEVSMLLTNIKHAVLKLNIGLEKDIGQNMEEISAILDELETRHNPKNEAVKNDRGRRSYGMHDERPPNDFRTLSVIPQIADINPESQPYLRTNLVDGAYKDTEHYLDVQFRLLREDFVRPLREGIENCFTAGGETNLRRKDQQNIKVYDNVRIEYPLPGRSGIQYCIQFNASKLQRVRWHTSRRLIYGNLVCLSSDKFKENFMFATVSERDPRYLQRGYVCIEFVCNNGIVGADVRQNLRDLINQGRRELLEDSDDEELLEEEEDPQAQENIQEAEQLAEETGNSLVTIQDMGKRYYMVETEAYFVAYRHVLLGLQDINRIPLERYIVRCQKIMRGPSYLRRTLNHQYDFSKILRKDESGNPIRNPKVDITDDQDWPSADELQLDQSQVAALKSALTNELSVIQGPPGTGKTHVGLEIMKLLLANKVFRNVQIGVDIRAGVQPAQILVVCFTNHALDQFLEGVVQFRENGVIRVGGRSKSKALERYSLTNVRKGRLHTSTTKFHRRTVFQLRTDLNRQRDFISSFTDILDISTRSIVKLSKLRQVIPAHLFQQLTEARLRGDEALLQWLGVSEPDHALYEKQYIVIEAVKAIAEPFVAAGFEFSLVVAAMIGSGQFEGKALLNWMLENPHTVENPGQLPEPDIVYAYLDQLHSPFDPQELLDEGFHLIEVKCALLATNFVRPDVQCIREWLRKKTQKDEESNQENGGDDGARSVHEDGSEDSESLQDDDDIAFIEEQRHVETDDDDDESIVDENENRKRRNEEAMKTIEREVAAATYDQLQSKIDSKQNASIGGGWQLQPEERKRRKRKINEQVGRVDAMTKRQAEEVLDLFQLEQNDRWKLYRRWIQDLRHHLRQQIDHASSEYNRLAKVLSDARNEEDFHILRTADVIGMTTTRAAQFRDIVRRLPAKVVIVEEAAEVLEAHIVTSLPQSTEHLILIGDHQQLKPSPTVYELAKKFNLEISLFERMIRNGIPCCKLELQHRMRPRIADLLRPHIYKNLRDHASVLMYDDVKGIQKNIFFVTHEQEEEAVADGKSKVNHHEAHFLVALCQYLHQQGYSLDQITILTTYVGQLHLINRLLPANLRKARVSAVDNFQGEENDIILLSLVRSNEEGKIGFLSIENRVCVALSRAKKGLYCIGNASILQEKSPLWRTIFLKLERDGLCGKKLPLHCSNHPNKLTLVETKKDFDKVPEGGCGEKCLARLPCGHACTRSCHPDDREHKVFKCRKPCERLCENKHPCKLLCFKECFCEVRVMKTIPRCGHQQKMKCHVDPSTFLCRTPCSDVRDCGHKCTGICGKPCPRDCTALVSVNPTCGHPPVKVECHLAANPPKSCTKPCDAVLLCGHKCPGNCKSCLQGRLHMRCRKKCERVLFCGHICQEFCSAKCPPCKRPCETACVHSKCSKKCFEPCVLCKEKCTARFPGNQKCSKLCSEPCDKQPSNNPCTKRLKCGHPCIGLAGEKCPELCRVCNKDKVTEIFLGREDEKGARFVELECKHIFNYVDLDKWMEQESTTNDDVTIQWKECPRCKTPIRKSNRYRHIVNKQLMLINEVKEKINGKTDDVETAKRALKAEIRRENNSVMFAANFSRLSPIEQNRETADFETLKIDAKNATTTNALSYIAAQFQKLKVLKKFKRTLNDTAVNATTIQWKTDVLQEITQLREWIFEKRDYFSEQELADFEGESKRLKHSISCLYILSTIAALSEYSEYKTNVNLKQKLSTAQILLHDNPRRYELIKEEVETLMAEIEEMAPSVVPGLGITAEERDMIVKTMPFGKGHWNKCRNGHVYCIGDCGGPSQTGICPECKEVIGGEGHRLADGNELAPEMDGATRPAYDPQNFNIPFDALH